MNPKPSKDLALNSGAYVLDALSDAEKAQFEALLAESEETRAEVTELSDTAVELGLSIAPVDPPASLRASILDLVANTPQHAPLPKAVEQDSDHELAPTAPLTDRPVIGLAEERARRRWFARPAVTLISAAAAVALVFGGGFAVNSAIQGQQLSATASQINQIQAAADYQRSTVKVATGGSATLIWSVELRRSAMMVKDLPELPTGKTYELWYIGEDGPTAAGTFTPEGSGLQSVVLEGKMGAGDRVGVTIEPAGGSKKPTSGPIAIIATA